MHKIKQIPEDFNVKELIKLKFDNGNYSYYSLKKKNLTTPDAINLISKKLNINPKNIGYCGNKDKNAVTEQYISILKKNKNLNLNNLELKFLGYGNKRINLGDNFGNEFIIAVRNLYKRYKKINIIVNYFDDQRFSKNNVLIGKYLLHGKFKEICEILNLDSINPLNSLMKLTRNI
jgi:tRNA pseudouridine13 synthase